MKRDYFNNLNYTLGNEDSSLEFRLLPKNTNHVFAVAGSGSRILPLLAKHPKYLTCVDISYPQLYLTELRIETLRSLGWEEFLAFWGYNPNLLTPEKRKKVFEKIQLSKPATNYLIKLFGDENWGSILYVGKWEKTFNKLSRINRLITGRRALELFEQKNSKTYFKYLKTKFPHKAWAITVFLLGNSAVFNTLLYKGSLPKKNTSEKLHKFYKDSLNKLFNQDLARNNFLLQLFFFGKLIYPEGNPIECSKEIFSMAKEGLRKTQISYVQGDVVEQAAKTNRKINFFSFSDVPSYFNSKLDKMYLQRVYPNLSLDCILVIRHYLRIPEGTDMDGFEDITNKYRNLINKEKTQMYLIKILRSTWKSK